MSEDGEISYENFTLPDSVVTKRDLYRLLKELEVVDGKMIESDVRLKVGIDSAGGIEVTEQMSQFLQQNNLNLDDSNQRSQIIRQLRTLKERIAVFSVTFAGPVKHENLILLVQWLRGSTSSQVVLAIGLQPNLVAGAHIRTKNRIFDFSFKSALENNRGNLIKEITSLTSEGQTSV